MDSILIDTPEGIEHFRWAAIISALRLEVHTGMRASRISALAAAQSVGCPNRTRSAALKWMEKAYTAMSGGASGEKRCGSGWGGPTPPPPAPA